MKKILVLTLALSLTLCSFAQNSIQQVFDTYQQKEGVISINVAKPMFGLLHKLKINTDVQTIKNLMPMLRGINSLKLLAVENGLLDEVVPEIATENLSADQLKQLAAEINKAVTQVNYMELITVHAKGRKLKFMTAHSDGTVLDNLLLSITSEKEGNLLLFLDGKINMEDVNKFIASENE